MASASKIVTAPIGTVEFYQNEIAVEIDCGANFNQLMRKIDNTTLSEQQREQLKNFAAGRTL